MLIYTDSISNRKKYIFNVLFFNVLGVSFDITENKSEFDAHPGPKICYSHSNDSSTPTIRPCGLLDETNIHPQTMESVEWNDYQLFFPIKGESLFPFDLFAVAFYLISRYEEYLPDRKKDMHGRFDAKQSISYQLGFHRLPMVQILAQALAEKIHEFYPDFVYSKVPYSITFTCDVDIAYKYKGKGIFRWCAGTARSLFQKNWTDFKHFLSIHKQDFHDPYDIYQETRLWATNSHANIIHFLPTGHYGKYDKNISYKTKLFKELVDELAQFSEIGLHPSYSSFHRQNKLIQEKKRLEKIYGKTVTQSRQHYLCFSFPETPQQLLKVGITDDYTLGWTNEVGFRSSIAIAHPWYDLSIEQETSLTLHPLAVMDVALPRITTIKENQLQILKEIVGTVKKYGGDFIILNHNTSEQIREQLTNNNL
ncbi:MAG: hypothetical protein MJZ76_07745 [Bacteroidales bacterium]|nr:hypothetical protein [Bacteroidales bacterium]